MTEQDKQPDKQPEPPAPASERPHYTLIVQSARHVLTPVTPEKVRQEESQHG